eukprot:scpid19573/ scgid35772/ UDP-GalNAc:beta-1,3-N-acetylgalactosaminyltransferase 2; Beta-1,3-N-acetylgalactosaminyltransferase II
MNPTVRFLLSGLLLSVLAALALLYSLDTTEQQRDDAVFASATAKSANERSPEIYRLVLAVLSARNHHERRHVIRETWGKEVRDKAGVKLEFVVGEECSVPVKLREDPQSCEQRQWKPDSGQEIHEAVSVGHESPSPVHDCQRIVQPDETLGIDFELLDDVVITHLGGYDQAQDGLHGTGQLLVEIYDSVLEKLIVSQALSSGDTELERRGHFLYKPVTNFAFPKGFLGSVVASGFSAVNAAVDVAQPRCNTAPSNASRASNDPMRLRRRSRHGMAAAAGFLPPMVESVFERTPRYLAASFLYTAHPTTAGKDVPTHDAQLYLIKEHRHQSFTRAQLLDAEQADYGDIVTVATVDTYRTLADKLMAYMKLLVDSTQFQFLLKTDDDCMLRVPAILNGIATIGGDLTRVWWGRFRRNWSVERFGKWRELDFTGKVYPPFACGSGSVLSRDAVAWIASNSQSLKPYQGEDVSLGMWLVAIGVKHWDDERWYCSADAYHTAGNRSDYLSVPNLTIDQMRDLWRKETT